MLCPSCSTSYLDPYGRCPSCGFVGIPPMATAPMAMGQPPKAPTGLSIAAQILLGVQAFATVGSFIGNVVQLSSLESNGVSSTTANVVSGFSVLLGVPTAIATVVVFIIWCYKVRTNAEVIAPQLSRATLARGWAIGGWFVPVGWFWLPRCVLGATWTASQPLGTDPRRTSTRSALLNSWWICWCAMWVTVIVSAITNGTASVNAGSTANVGVPTLEALNIMGMVGAALRLAAAVLALFVVRKITTLQQVRILQGPGEGHPYAVPLPQQMLAPMPLATAPQYPAAQYPAPQYAAPQYAGQPYPGQPYPGQPYPGQQPVPQAQPLQQPPLPAQPMLPQQPGYVAAQPYQATVPATPAPEPEPTDAAPVDAKPVDATPVDATPGTPDAPETAV